MFEKGTDYTIEEVLDNEDIEYSLMNPNENCKK